MAKRKMSPEHLAKLAEGRRKRAETRASRTPLMLTKNIRLYPTDKRNWSLQKLSAADGEEENWISEYHFPKLKDALRAVASRLVDRSLRGISTDPVKFRELADLIEEAENNVLAAIGNLAENFIDAESDDEEEEL